jgi:hypothetical protein
VGNGKAKRSGEWFLAIFPFSNQSLFLFGAKYAGVEFNQKN